MHVFRLKSFISAGILKRMEKIVYGKLPTHNRNHNDDPVELESVGTIFWLMGWAYLCAVLILLLEIIFYRLKM